MIIDFVVDTGFTYFLMLPPPAVAALGLPFLHNLPANLADDSTVNLAVHTAQIVWEGSTRLRGEPIKQRHFMKKRTTTHDDWARLKTPLDPQISPDASRIAYVVKTTNRDKNRYESHVWVTNTQNGGPGRQWTNSSGENGGESSPRWSPDGNWLAFTSGRDDKKGQVFRISTQGGEAEKLTDLPAGSLSDIQWSPDGSQIAFTFRPQDDEWREKAVEERKKAKQSSPPRVFTRRHWREEGTGFVPRLPYHVHVLTVETREVHAVTTGDDRNFGPFCWSPDSKQLAVVSNVDTHPDLRPNADALFVYPAHGLAGDAEKPLSLNAPLGPKGDLAWSPDGKYIAYLGHDKADEVWGVTNVHPWIVAAGGAAPARDLTPDWDVQVGNASLGDVVGSGDSGPVWASDSQSLLVLTTENGSVDVYRVPLSEGAGRERLTEGRHAIAGFTADATAQTLALLRATPTDGGDLYGLSLADGSHEPRRLTDLNAELFSGLHLPEPIAFDAPSPEGHTVPCWAILPPDFADDPTPRPTILYIHGGPHLMYAHTLFHEYQALAARGYVVVYPNPRGSKGYGEAWTAGIKGNWGTPAHSDCDACLDYAIRKGWADADKLGVAGGSYGGYLTGWMVGHSNRFKAAVAERGVFNLQSMAGTCDFVWRDHDYFHANTTGDPGDYLKNSPLTYADDITTPLLIIHSEGDLRCPIEQAEQLFAALVMRNRDVTFLRYGPESNHNLSRGGPPDLRADRQERIAEFFARHLKGI